MVLRSCSYPCFRYANDLQFVEAMTQLRARAGRDNFMQIHVSYVPSVHGEQKTKPTQMAIRTIRSAGLFPDSIAIRAEKPVSGMRERYKIKKTDCSSLSQRLSKRSHGSARYHQRTA